MIVYNEIEPYPSQWLRNLSDAGHIASGHVIEGPIQDIQGSDLYEHDQFHAFAGIGAWSCALRLAGWPDDLPVWTGSCPCQPFSVAGKGKGVDDERHLWPEWLRLIEQCRPSIIFGEQVASRAGRGWLSSVRADLEALGYAVGAADLCAAGAGAPHIRQRLYFGAIRLGDTDSQRPFGQHALLRTKDIGRDRTETISETAGTGEISSLGDTNYPGLERYTRDEPDRQQHQTPTTQAGCWSDTEWVQCWDGKTRPFEPGTFPLAPRTPNHVGRLRAYGNAIIPQVAAAFITAFMEA